MVLYEKWRPKSLDEIVGQDDVVKRLKMIGDRGGWLGQVFWFYGPSGGGKTSAARIIAKDIAKPYRYVDMNAQDVTLDFLRDAEKECRMRPLGAQGYAYVIDEAHLLRDAIVSQLQTVLEKSEVMRNSTWIFSTTPKGNAKLFDAKFDAEPFISRAKVYEFSTHGHELDFAQRVMEIARAEEMDGQPLEAYIALVRRCNGNMRKCLQEVENGCMIV